MRKFESDAAFASSSALLTASVDVSRASVYMSDTIFLLVGPRRSNGRLLVKGREDIRRNPQINPDGSGIQWLRLAAGIKRHSMG